MMSNILKAMAVLLVILLLLQPVHMTTSEYRTGKVQPVHKHWVTAKGYHLVRYDLKNAVDSFTIRHFQVML